MIREFRGKKPFIHHEAIIDESAMVMGNVVIGKKASIWPHVLIRADDAGVEIEEDVAILDKAFIEAPRNVFIGKGSIISHGAIIHGSTIGENVLVGMGAIVMEVEVGDNAIIAAGSVVTSDVEKNCMVAGIPAKKIREINERDVLKMEEMRRELKEKAVCLRKDEGD